MWRSGSFQVEFDGVKGWSLFAHSEVRCLPQQGRMQNSYEEKKSRQEVNRENPLPLLAH
jgi:hypothetical protein